MVVVPGLYISPMSGLAFDQPQLSPEFPTVISADHSISG